MARKNQQRRFVISPVELGIFCIVAILFLNSVYDLFYDWKGVQPEDLGMTAEKTTADRVPAANTKRSFDTIKMTCDSKIQRKKTRGDTSHLASVKNGQATVSSGPSTQAAKIRLTGPLCGIKAASESRKLVKTEITNQATEYSATIFTDHNTGTYQTDFISLNSGQNPIEIKFRYKDGRTLTQKVMITRN